MACATLQGLGHGPIPLKLGGMAPKRYSHSSLIYEGLEAIGL
jgi:hypothetical protein